MRKIYTCLLMAFMWSLALFGWVNVRAAAEETDTGIFDDANLLSEAEESELSASMKTIEAEHQIHLLIVTTEDTQEKAARDYADDFFEEHNGDGASGSGLLLLIDMQHSELYISTSGEEIIHTFTDARLDSILDGVYDEVVNNNFFGGCQQFLNDVGNNLGMNLSETVSGELGDNPVQGVESEETAAGLNGTKGPLVQKHVFDDAALFDGDEVEKLEKRIGELESKAGFLVLITTTNSSGGKTSRDYAENFFLNHNNSGRISDGIVYLINMEAREIYVYASGNSVIESFSEANIDKMLDRIYKKVSDGKYYKSCGVFLDNAARYGVKGGGRLSPFRVICQLLICMLIGAVIVFFMARNRGGRVDAGVNNYFVAGGANEILHRDKFINRTVSRQRIKRDDGGKGGRSGGSSVHRSSSGTMHGGGGRSFGGGSRGGGRKF